ncbi:MAG TPA: hypothetical protein VIO61_02230 [Anaerolineaceae bacterium]
MKNNQNCCDNKRIPRLLVVGILSFVLVLSISCGTTPTPTPTPNPFAQLTTVAKAVQATREVEMATVTAQAAKAALEQTAEALKVTQAAVETRSVPPTSQPTYTALPTYTLQPSPTLAPTKPPETPTLVPTTAPTIASAAYAVTVSTKTFYCYQEPSQLKVSVAMPDINKGAAVYFRLRDKFSGQLTAWANKDLHRDTGNIRSVVINGSGYSGTKDVIHPPLMKESIFEMQIITDDGTYRSNVYTDITYFPCAQ